MGGRSVCGGLLASSVVLLVLVGCEEVPRATLAVDASARPLPPAPPHREGCARAGSLDGLESDPTCLVKRSSDDAQRSALKQVAIALSPESAEVVAGGTALLALTIENTSSAEAMLVFEARARPSGPRTDWSRVAGVPEPRPAAVEIPRILLPITTTDANNRDVDALPTVSGSALGEPQSTLLAVRLRPGAKLTRSVSWWALRIPAPPPVVTDDAGHRYVPKTSAQSLQPGEYNVNIDVPLAGLGREERRVGTRVRVTRAPLPDGGTRPPFSY